jgi:3-methyladenine DNA glycosylase AlkD
VDEKKFFIRKAIGWTLREIAQTDPALAEKLIREFWDRASGMTRREALRRLPAARRKVLLAELG